MTTDAIWSIAQDIVDEINNCSMVEYERYEISQSVAMLVADIEYAYEKGSVECLETYFSIIDDLSDDEELWQRFKDLMIDIMHSAVKGGLVCQNGL